MQLLKKKHHSSEKNVQNFGKNKENSNINQRSDDLPRIWVEISHTCSANFFWQTIFGVCWSSSPQNIQEIELGASWFKECRGVIHSSVIVVGWEGIHQCQQCHCKHFTALAMQKNKRNCHHPVKIVWCAWFGEQNGWSSGEKTKIETQKYPKANHKILSLHSIGDTWHQKKTRHWICFCIHRTKKIHSRKMSIGKNEKNENKKWMSDPDEMVVQVNFFKQMKNENQFFKWTKNKNQFFFGWHQFFCDWHADTATSLMCLLIDAQSLTFFLVQTNWCHPRLTNRCHPRVASGCTRCSSVFALY